jgi:hypothetical protein
MNAISKLTQVIVLGIGFSILWGIVIGALVDVIAPITSNAINTRNYDEHGDLYLQTDVGYRRWDSSTYTAPDPQTIQLQLKSLPAKRLVEHSLYDRMWQPAIISWRDVKIQKVETGREEPEHVNHGDYYYFIYNKEKVAAGYFLIYDGVTARLKHYMGQNGFTSTKPPKEDCFEVFGTNDDTSEILLTISNQENGPQLESDFGDNEATRIVNTGREKLFTAYRTFVRTADSKVYSIDLRQGTATSVTDHTVIQAKMGSYYKSRFEAESRLTLRCPDVILSYTREGQLDSEWRIPEDLKDEDFSVAETIDHQLVMEWLTKDVSQNQFVVNYLVVGSDGQVVARHNDVDRFEAVFGLTRYQRLRSLAVIPIPTICLLQTITDATNRSAFAKTSFFIEFVPSVIEYLDAITTGLFVSISLAVLFVFRQRSVGKPIVWWHVVLILLFGLCAFVALMWTNPRPIALEKLETPPRLGTEVFA